MDAVGALRLSPLRRGFAIDSTVDIFTFYVPHRHVYGEQWIKFMKDGVNATPLPTVFFFSCRRRHTVCLSDWSSDVCSSDLSDRECRRFLPRSGVRERLEAPHVGPVARSPALVAACHRRARWTGRRGNRKPGAVPDRQRSEEHTSELQSLRHLVCRLLLEKKK